MSRADVSVDLNLTGQKNPFHGSAAVMLEHKHKLAAVAIKVRQIMQQLGMTNPGLVNVNEIIKHMPEEYKELVGIGQKMFNKEPAITPKLEPPPSVKEQYQRVERTAPLLDVGSGNAAKVQGHGFVDVVTLDPEHDSVANYPHKKKCFELEDAEERITVSRMSITQVGEVIEDTDGIHVGPDLSSWAEAGYSKNNGDGTFTTEIRGEVYHDKQVDLPGVNLSKSYIGYNTYKKTNIDLRLSNVKMRIPPLKIFGNKGNIPTFSEKYVTRKLDGKMYRVKRTTGGVGLFSRNGTGFQLDGCPDLECDLEYYEGNFHLVCVSYYKGFRPWHGYEPLCYFLQRTRLNINGMRVLPPELVVIPLGPNEEGIVKRDGRNDYLFRQWHSFDTSDPETLAKEITDYGMEAVVKDKKEGFWEYVLREGVLVPNKPRRDKFKDDIGNCHYLLKLPLCGQIELEGVDLDEAYEEDM